MAISGPNQIMLDYALGSCILLSRDFKVISVSRQTLELFGRDSEEELAGKHFAQLLPVRRADGKLTEHVLEKLLAEVLETGEGSFEMDVERSGEGGATNARVARCVKVKHDGEVYIAVYIHKLYGNCGCHTAKEKQELEKKLESLIVNIPMAIVTFDNKLIAIECNRAAVELFGMRDRASLLRNFMKTLPERQPNGKSSKSAAKELATRCFEEGTVVFEWMHIRDNGELMPSEITLTRFERRQEFYFLAFVKDMRDHYNYRRIEYAQQQRLQAILDSSPFVCAIIDRDYNVLEVNRKAEDLFEIPDKQLFINDMHSFSPLHQPCGELSKTKSQAFVKEAFETGSARHEWTYQTRDGKPILTEEYLERVRLAGNDVLMLYIRDLQTDISRQLNGEGGDTGKRVMYKLPEPPD